MYSVLAAAFFSLDLLVLWCYSSHQVLSLVWYKTGRKILQITLENALPHPKMEHTVWGSTVSVIKDGAVAIFINSPKVLSCSLLNETTLTTATSTNTLIQACCSSQ